MPILNAVSATQTSLTWETIRRKTFAWDFFKVTFAYINLIQLTWSLYLKSFRGEKTDNKLLHFRSEKVQGELAVSRPNRKNEGTNLRRRENKLPLETYAFLLRWYIKKIYMSISKIHSVLHIQPFRFDAQVFRNGVLKQWISQYLAERSR